MNQQFEADQVKRAQLIKQWADAMREPSYYEGLLLLARDMRLKYRALTSEGFSRSEALEIIIKKGFE